jgi:hypothetical protein
MNKRLWQEIYKKRPLHNKFLKQKTNKNWEAYRKQRNFVNKLKKKSAQKYFYERCAGGPKSSDFWLTIKPFLSSKGVKTNNSYYLKWEQWHCKWPQKSIRDFQRFFHKCSQKYWKPEYSYWWEPSKYTSYKDKQT